MFKRFCFVIAALCFCQMAVAQPAQSTLIFQLEGLKASPVILGYYRGGQAYRVDSAVVETPNGQCRFQNERLQPGVYFLTAGNTRLFDFILASTTDSFSIQGMIGQLKTFKVDNSPENVAYFAFESARKDLEEKIAAKNLMLDMVNKATKGDKEALKPVRDELEQLFRSGDSLAMAFTQQGPSSLYAQMLLSVRPPEPPRTLKPTLNGKPNPNYRRWLRAHYFDQTDFKDERLLNNNFWQAFFDGFFARHVTPQPDSLIIAIDEVIAQMPRNGAFYRFAVMRVAQYFEQTEAPGADRVFVHMADKYLKKDDTPWLDIATLERLAYKADVHRSNLTGSLAVNFELSDEKDGKHTLYEVEAPVTVLVFYSPLCDHCKELMPKIYQVYLDYLPKGLKAVAVNTDKQMVYWKKFVAQQGWQWLNLASPKGLENLEKQYATVNLPVIYLLDKDKRILNKWVQADKLGEALSTMPWK